MRFTEILLEAVSTYRPMFNGINVDQKIIDQTIAEVESVFKRKDRVTQALKFKRLILIRELERDKLFDASEMDDRILKRMQAVLDETGGLSPSGAYRELEHMLSLTQTYPFLDNISWDTSFEKLADAFEQQKQKIEDYNNKRKESGVEIQEGDVAIIKFGGGWAWWKLSRGGCRDEARVMGHCGNGSGSYGQSILSLRKDLGGGLWEPHLTFIYDGVDHALGEMKGRGNEKPAARYHPYIVKLLKHPMIEKIKGGGYLPQNNFSLDDLDEEVKEELLELKPDLRSGAEGFYAAWLAAKTPDEEREVAEKYEDVIEEYLSGDYTFDLTEMAFISNSRWYPLEDDLTKILSAIQSEVYAAIEDGDDVNTDVLKPIKDSLLELFYGTLYMGFSFGEVTFDSSDVDYDLDSYDDLPSATHKVSLDEVMVEVTQNDHDGDGFEEAARYIELDRTGDDQSYSDYIWNIDSDFEKELSNELSRNGNNYGKTALFILNQHDWKDMTRNNNGYTPTINDPRQLSFLDRFEEAIQMGIEKTTIAEGFALTPETKVAAIDSTIMSAIKQCVNHYSMSQYGVPVNSLDDYADEAVFLYFLIGYMKGQPTGWFNANSERLWLTDGNTIYDPAGQAGSLLDAPMYTVDQQYMASRAFKQRMSYLEQELTKYGQPIGGIIDKLRSDDGITVN